jgi:hypothetical protein
MGTLGGFPNPGSRLSQRRNGWLVVDISKKAMTRIRNAIREVAWRTCLSLEDLIHQLNQYIRNAAESFRLASSRTMWTFELTCVPWARGYSLLSKGPRSGAEPSYGSPTSTPALRRSLPDTSLK